MDQSNQITFKKFSYALEWWVWKKDMQNAYTGIWKKIFFLHVKFILFIILCKEEGDYVLIHEHLAYVSTRESTLNTKCYVPQTAVLICTNPQQNIVVYKGSLLPKNIFKKHIKFFLTKE